MKYPILHLDFPIPVTIGSGRAIIDEAGVMRLELFTPEDQIVVLETLAPTERDVVERPEHHETCCQAGEDTLDDELSCDAECWCHTMPHLASDMPESTAPWALQRMCNCTERQAKWDRGETAPACPVHGATLWPVKFDDEVEEPTYDPRAAGATYPSAANPCPLVLDHSTHEWYSPFSSTPLRCPGIKGPDPVIEEQLEDRLDYDARGQNYTQMMADTNPWGKVVLTVCGSGKGDGCGAVVYDTEQHDLFHVKTRSMM